MLRENVGLMTLEDCFLLLVDENVETAIEFKALFWQKMIDSGRKVKTCPREDVIQFYNEFIRPNGVKNESE